MDLITHVASLSKMAKEAIATQSDEDSQLAKYFTIDEDGQSVTFNASKVPVVYAKDGQTLCLVRGVPKSVLDSSTSIKVLGSVSGSIIEFYNDDCKDIYESIYDTATKIIKDDGGDYEYTPPYLFGRFC